LLLLLLLLLLLSLLLSSVPPTHPYIRHLDRRWRTLPPQWRDPRILPWPFLLLRLLSLLSLPLQLLLLLPLGRAGLQPRVKSRRAATSALPKAGAQAKPKRLIIAFAVVCF